MSVQSFDELAGRITDKIKSRDTRMRLVIPPLEMLAVTVRDFYNFFYSIFFKLLLTCNCVFYKYDSTGNLKLSD